jgi:hypothetical protein
MRDTAMPAWTGDALRGAAIGALIALGLVLLGLVLLFGVAYLAP